jgi:hypothetical protein
MSAITAPADPAYVRIRAWVQMSAIAGSSQEETVEVVRSEWDAMNADQRAIFLADTGRDFMTSKVEFGADLDED